MSDTTDLDELIKMSQIDVNALKPELFGNIEKLRTIVRFNKAKKDNSKLSQIDICKSIGTSVSSVERMRKDLSIPSPYRYSVSTKTEAQKDKDKYRQKVYSAFKSGIINESAKIDLYSQIKSSLDKDVKDKIKSLIIPDERIKSLIIPDERKKTRERKQARGGNIDFENNMSMNAPYNDNMSMNDAINRATEIASKINL